MTNSVYREEILEHYRNPQNYGELADADQILEIDNPLCGDYQKWFVKLSKVNGSADAKALADRQLSIVDIKFTSEGCAISTAAASLLSEHLKGMLVADLANITEEKMSELIGTRVTPGRVKCLMLPVSALKLIK